MDRRKFLIGALSVPAGVALAGKGVGLLGGGSPGVASEALLRAKDLKLKSGTPFPLVSLPGKAPMGQVYDRPPNYETPAEHLIGTKNYPYTDNEYYYVRYREASVLELTPENYRLKIGGDAADNEITLTLDELNRRATTTIGAVGVCSGEGRGLHHPMIPGMPWTKGDLSCAEWTGIPLKDLLHEVGVKDSAYHVSFGGGRVISLAKPQYWRSYPIETVMEREPLIATKMNGEDIPFWNGYPVRLVFPGTWAPTWTKQLVEIDIRSTANDMEWSGREITPNELKPFSLIVTPTDGTQIPVNRRVELTGVAYDYGAGITKVEISQDEGATWEPAKLEKSYGKYTWRVWRAEVGFDSTGENRVLSRATNADGEVQPLDPAPDVMETGARKETASKIFAGVYEVV
ncbi:MAG TPA: molybdopterin-dependent oxidoreductase [Nocardioidaceae bacterium]|nr:molybdopterin-dependent oxidoreductase [Nocardioidaceae bacterium]